MRTISRSESDLLLALHDGQFEQPLWHSFLERLRIEAGASYSAMFFRPVDNASMVQLFAGKELAQHLQQILFDRFGTDPLPHHRMRPERIYALDEFMDSNDPVQRAFYDEVLWPGGMRYFRSVRVTEPSGVDAWLTVINDQDFNASAATLLSRIVPHFRSALRSFIAFERERFRSSVSSEAFGRLNFGWLTVDARCRVVDMTPNIDQILQRTRLLRRGRYDRLTFASSSVDREVSDLVQRFSDSEESRPRAINLSQDPWVDMLVAPIQDRFSSPGSTAAAIVYLSGDRWSRDDRCEQLVELFGLLPSEARLAWAIAQGNSIAQAAEELGLSIETARNYSKKIYSKTGASGQAELVRIIFTSVLAII